MDIEYKGYLAKMWYSASVGLFYGEILKANTLFVFQGSTPKEIKERMAEIIDTEFEFPQKSIST